MTYNPAMRVAVISDVHCAGLDCPRAAAFVAWLDDLDVDEVWMLGDIFHYGWIFGGALQPDYALVFEALDRVAERKIRLVFIPGNHDFRMAPLMASRWGAEVSGPHIREVDGVRVHLSHGDEADSSLGYRLVEAFLRGRLSEWMMRVLGVGMGTAMLRRLAGKVAPIQSVVWPATIETLTEHLEGADMAIMGHAHVPWVQQDARGVGVVLGPGVQGAMLLCDGQLA
jgi:UDP-2,3-diacylglucosamine pyrophosphatase LpxH